MALLGHRASVGNVLCKGILTGAWSETLLCFRGVPLPLQAMPVLSVTGVLVGHMLCAIEMTSLGPHSLFPWKMPSFEMQRRGLETS